MSEKSKLMEEHIIVPGEKQPVILPNDLNALSLHKMAPSAFIFQFNDVDNKNKEMGKLFNKDGKLCFEGNADESAKILFECAIVHYDQHIKKLDDIIKEKDHAINLLKEFNNNLLKEREETNRC